MLGNLKRKIGEEGSSHSSLTPIIMMQFPVVVLSLGPTALASILKQFPVNTGGETSVRPLITHLNAVNASTHPSLSSDAEQWDFDQGFRKIRQGTWSSMPSIHFCNAGQIHGVVMVRSFSALCWCYKNVSSSSSFIGNSIVLGAGVSLYHGTHLDTIPTESDWIAGPREFVIFCRGVDGNVWHLTLVAMRPLKVYTIPRRKWYRKVHWISKI